jgi:hypothetical protein
MRGAVNLEQPLWAAVNVASGVAAMGLPQQPPAASPVAA